MRGTLLEAQSSHGTHPWGRAPLHRHESVARPLLGLLVVWFTMFTVFMAHHMSDYDIELAHESAKSPAPDNVFLYPLKLYSRGTSPRQGLLNIAQNVGLQVDPINLDKLGDEPRTLDYRDVPLYKVLHDLLGTTSLGVAFQGHTLRVINQRLEIQQQSDGKRMIDWKAGRIALSRLPLVIVPSGESDIWFSIRMVGALLPDEELRTVQFEVWRDAEWITMARAVLNNQGYAQLSLSTIETIAFSVQTVTAPKGEDPGLYDLGFYCLSSGQ